MTTDSDIPRQDPEPGDRRDPSKGRPGDRRRGGWRDFRQSYPGFVFTLLLAVVIMLALDGFLLVKRNAYGREVARLQANMSEQERAQTDAIVESEENKTRLALELARMQAKVEKTLHLSVAVDSGKIYLEREGFVLREIPATFGPEAKVGPDSIPVVIPRGETSIARISDTEIALDFGTLITATKAVIPSQDTAPIPPGGVRISDEDLRAIMPNLSLGMRVYFY
ncbi:MAG: hypothetical protein ABIS03_12255 [Gemmatimonadaceae bacterium]